MNAVELKPLSKRQKEVARILESSPGSKIVKDLFGGSIKCYLIVKGGMTLVRSETLTALIDHKIVVEATGKSSWRGTYISNAS